jgi:hypothetical protein
MPDRGAPLPGPENWKPPPGSPAVVELHSVGSRPVICVVRGRGVRVASKFETCNPRAPDRSAEFTQIDSDEWIDRANARRLWARAAPSRSLPVCRANAATRPRGHDFPYPPKAITSTKCGSHRDPPPDGFAGPRSVRGAPDPVSIAELGSNVALRCGAAQEPMAHADVSSSLKLSTGVASMLAVMV